VDDELIRIAAQALKAAADGDEAAARAALEHLDPDLASRAASLLVELMHPGA
jgi:hypothetical protein